MDEEMLDPIHERVSGGRFEKSLVRKALEIEENEYRIVILDDSHIERIRLWRNEQIAVLRQHSIISRVEQINWYNETVIPEMDSDAPEFILFGFLRYDEMIGYGGLTNISWRDDRAEVSFLMATERSENSESYPIEMGSFLSIIKRVAKSLMISRLVSETYEFRKRHIEILEEGDFKLEGRLRGHILRDGEFVDSVCHAWINRDASR